MIVFVSNLLLLSACSSDNDESGDSKARYYIKYTVTGGSWYRPPFGHTSNPTPTTIKFQDKNSIVTESQSGSIKFTKVVGPVNNNLKSNHIICILPIYRILQQLVLFFQYLV